MKYLLALVLLILPLSAYAEELYTQTPHCADLKNDTTSNEFVSIRTDFYTQPSGKRSYYEQVLHLEPGKTLQVCAKGPFFPDYKVELNIKSFVPLFECKTKLQGTITIHEKPSEITDGRTIWADCVN